MDGDAVTSAVLRVARIAWPVAEVLVLWAVAQAFGWGWVLVICIAGVAAALLVLGTMVRNFREGLDGLMRGRGVTTVDPTTGATSTVFSPRGAAGSSDSARVEQGLRESGVLLSAAGLLALPGLLSDSAGLLMLLPPVRRMLVARMSAQPATFNVVPGETLHRSQDLPNPGPHRPVVITGEIIPPPDPPRG
jgi:UPF0716 family protein affecting phage T7 exclusion